MWNKHAETFLGCDKEYRQAGIVMFGAPFDSTTSYRPGARFASREMRMHSFGLETYSPYQARDLCDDASVFDAGDLELCFGDPQTALTDIEKAAAQILKDGKLPVMIGGEHLVTLGAVRAALVQHPDLHIVQFDAHADLRDHYLGAKLSHATVMRRCHDLIGDKKIFQFGIRSGEREEFSFAKDHCFQQKFTFYGLHRLFEKLADKPVYFTIDLDVLDAAVFPGTGTPEAGGVSFLELIDAIQDVCQLRIVGCDLCELSPVYDQSGCSTATACKVLRELLLALKT